MDWLEQLFAGGISVSEIASMAGCTPRTVRNRANAAGIGLPRSRLLQRRQDRLADRAWLTEAVAEGKTPSEIARRCEVSTHDVVAALQRADIVVAKVRRRPPQLADRDWLSARLGDGVPLVAIAAQIGCHESTLRRAVRDHGLSRPTRRRYPQLGDRDWLTTRYVERRDPVDQIAAELGCSPGAVLLAVHREGLQRPRRPRRHRRFTQLDDAAWLRSRLRGQRWRTIDIAADVGCGVGAVRRAIHAHGLRQLRPRFALLQDRDWLETQYPHRTAGDIARELGCAKGSVVTALAL